MNGFQSSLVSSYRVLIVAAWIVVAGCGGADCPEGRIMMDGECVCPEDAGATCAPADGGMPAEEDASRPLADPPSANVVARFPWNGYATGSIRAAGGRAKVDPLRPKFMWEIIDDAVFYQFQADNSCEIGAFSDCAFDSPELDVQVTESFDDWRERGVPENVIGFTPDEDFPIERKTAAPVGERYFWRVRACTEEESCTEWTDVRYLDVGRLTNDYNGDGFGDVLVGGSGDDSLRGAAVVYFGNSDGRISPAASEDHGWSSGTAFGASVSEAGDINGDGFGDVIVGAPNFGTGSGANKTLAGAVLVFYGSATGLTDGEILQNPDFQGGRFGRIVSGVGDVNGDGFADVVISAIDQDRGAAREGNAFLYLGSAVGLRVEPVVTFDNPTNQEGGRFGVVAPVGDIDGDGFVDIVIGTTEYNAAESKAGRAYVYLGSSETISNEPDATLENPEPETALRFGAVGTGGDFNGDGLSDLLIGAPDELRSESPGAVYVYFGITTGVALSPGQRISNPLDERGTRFGFSLSGGHDLDGDDFADVAIGAYGAIGGSGEQSGTVHVFSGSAEGIEESDSRKIDGQETESFGFSVSTQTDTQGDGVYDLVVGDPGFRNGRAYVFLGIATSGVRPNDATIVGFGATKRFGLSVR